jgi:hypothetical protein
MIRRWEQSIICVWPSVWLAVMVTAAHGRTWTMADGRSVLEANFVMLRDDIVTLKSPDNVDHDIPIANLSEIDRNLAERLGVSSSKPIQVDVESEGLTPADALRNALMESVRQAIGARVKSKTVLEGDSVVEDEILMFSDGFVSDYKKVASRRKNGLCYERIKATVQRRDVSERPSAAETARDASYLFAEAFTKVQRHKVGMAVFQDALDRFNADLLDVSLSGRDKTEVIPGDLNHVNVHMDLRVRINMDRYRALYEDLTASLTAVSRSKGGFVTRTVVLKPDDTGISAVVGHLEKQFLNTTSTSTIDYGTVFSLDGDRKPAGGPNVDAIVKRDADATLVYVCVPPGGSPGSLPAKSRVWRWFEVDGHPLMPAQSISTVVRYAADDGESVLEDSVSFGAKTPGLSASGRGKKVRTVIVSPYFLYHLSQGHAVTDIPHAREITIHKKLRMPLESLSRVKSEGVFVTGQLLNRQEEFPADVEGRAETRGIVRRGRPVGEVERFKLRGGVIEVKSTEADGKLYVLLSAKGFEGDQKRLREWLETDDFREMMQRRVLMAAAGGGAFTAEVGPFTSVADDLVTVEVTVKRR